MDREHLMALAKDAGLPTAWISDSGVLTWFDLEHFATLVAAHEREACAKVCDDLNFVDNGTPVGTRASNRHCAAAIRSRT